MLTPPPHTPLSLPLPTRHAHTQVQAMEQQTISVAKAGITTILNSRCSVLAAANPRYGRYDDTKSIADNIDLLPTILSRFDLIFIVRDTRDADRDRLIARHVVALHVTARDTTEEQEEGEAAARKGGEIDLATMKKFIAYARSKCAPVVTGEAAEMLAGEYADIRQMAEGAAREKQSAAAGAGSGRGEGGGGGGGAHTVGCAVPITVRQLEALVRVTEAVAKASLSREATLEHVKEALALFKKSTLAAAQQGNGLGDVLSADVQLSVRACEARILKVVGAGQTLPVAHVKSQLRGQGFDEGVINTALRVMDSRDEIKLVEERKMVRRHR
jgi:DNA replication licensing factor MCM5